MKIEFPPFLPLSSAEDINFRKKWQEQHDYFQNFYEKQYLTTPDIGVFTNEK